MSALVVECEPATEELLRAAGIGRGMHVLNLGCGEGEVSLLAAALVGPNGLVLGVDQDAARVESARNRARGAGLHHVYFLHAAVDGLPDEAMFDVVIKNARA